MEMVDPQAVAMALEPWTEPCRYCGHSVPVDDLDGELCPRCAAMTEADWAEERATRRAEDRADELGGWGR